jgi:hypothetical protein
MLASTVALSGLVGVCAMVLPLDEGTKTSALIGALAASVMGTLVIVLKTQLGKGLTGAAALKVMMTSLGLTFMLRLLTVAMGAIVLKQSESLSPIAFVIAFFISSLLQQLLEMRSLLGNLPVKQSSQVIS